MNSILKNLFHKKFKNLISSKSFFKKYQAQTTDNPLGLEIKKARGCYIYDINNKKYLDLVAGVSACSLGHSNKNVLKAIKKQLKKYLHVMVYGEFIQNETVLLCKLISENVPKPLQTTYLTNSGTEAIEGALKLAKRVTGRTEIISAKNSYHGSTMGAMSVMGFEERISAYRPLVPGTKHIAYNSFDDIKKISKNTAAVILESIQGGAGFIEPKKNYLNEVKKQCEKTGALLILDEIQPGIGRTGKLFSFSYHDVIPDILVIGKGLGGGLPVGAFIASKKNMSKLKFSPILGHITTFGGNPLISAACRTTLQTIILSKLIENTRVKEKIFRDMLIHPLIKKINGKGLMLALIMDSEKSAQSLVKIALENGVILFFLLFESKAVRITPPLIISESQIREACKIIIYCLNKIKC